MNEKMMSGMAESQRITTPETYKILFIVAFNNLFLSSVVDNNDDDDDEDGGGGDGNGNDETTLWNVQFKMSIHNLTQTSNWCCDKVLSEANASHKNKKTHTDRQRYTLRSSNAVAAATAPARQH